MTSDPSRDAAARVLDAALHRWKDMPPLRLTYDRRDVYLLIGGLQSLVRHPELPPGVRARFELLGRDLQNRLSDDAELYAMIEVGWNPAHDVKLRRQAG